MQFRRLRKFFNCVKFCLRCYNTFPMDSEISKTSNREPKELGSKFHDDAPINIPKHDLLGYKNLARAVANSILENRRPEGSVIAINGAWGVGKSSTINLVCHEISESNSDIIIVKFNSWCYRSEEGIVSGFFQELYSGLRSNKKFQNFSSSLDSLVQLAHRSSGVTNVIGHGLNSFIPGSGYPVLKGNNYIKKRVSSEEKIESLQKKVGRSLRETNTRVLVVIDDIDRLSPEEAIAIFRVIKSVGRLRNVIYLLGYDRKETEKMIRKKYKFGGSIYLEKIVQASFDIPVPSYFKISETLRYRLFKIFEDDISHDSKRLSSIVAYVIKPEIETLRNVYRLTNALLTTYPSVKGKVDPLDFIVLETLRLFRPKVYKMIRLYKNELTDPEKYISSSDGSSETDVIHHILTLSESDEGVQGRLKFSLLEVFPRVSRRDLKSDAYNARIRSQENRASSPLHFDTYFQFSVLEDAISNREFEEIIKNSSDKDFVQSRLRNYLTKNISHGETVASYLLDKISYKIDSTGTKDMKILLLTLHSISEDIRMDFNVNIDESIPVSYKVRILRLSKKFLLGKSDAEEKYEFLLEVFKVSSLDIIMRLCRWVLDTDPNDSIFTEEEKLGIEEMIFDRVNSEIGDGSILYHKNFPRIFSDWASIPSNPEKSEHVFRSMLGKDYKNVVLAANRFMETFDSEELRRFSDNEKREWMSGYIDVGEFDYYLRMAEKYIKLKSEEKKRIEKLLNIIATRLSSSSSVDLSIHDLDSYDFID